MMRLTIGSANVSAKIFWAVALVVLTISGHVGLSLADQENAQQDSENQAKKLQRLVLILVQFSDVRHVREANDVQLVLDRLHSYYLNVSYGQFILVSSIVGRYALNRSLSYYGQDLPGPTLGTEHGDLLIFDSIAAAQHDLVGVEFDKVGLVHAGSDQRISNVTSDLWPHYWPITMTLESGLRIEGAFYVSEFSEVGIYAHEFAHSLGLPDLYPRNTSLPRLIGDFSLMDSGAWLGYPRQSSPSGLDAWSLIQLNWIEATNTSLTHVSTTFNLVPLTRSSGNRVVRIVLERGLYYLLELRRRVGIDKELPYDALLVSRVNETRVNETARMGYDGYGIMNSTALPISDSGALFADSTRNVYVQLAGCGPEECTVRTASLLAIPAFQSIPSSVEAFTPFQIAIRFTDWNHRPLSNLTVTLVVDGRPIQLVTNDGGEIRHTLFFWTLGEHRVQFRVPGIVWPPISERLTEVQFPYTVLVYSLLIVLATVIIILAMRQKGRQQA